MMREEFLSGTKMIDANGEKEGVNEIAEYLFSPENI